MSDLSFNPLNEYRNKYAGTFKQIAEKTFGEMAAESMIDKRANKDLCNQIYAKRESLSTTKRSIKLWKTACVLLWILAVVCLIMVIFPAKLNDTLYMVANGVGAGLSVLFLLIKVHPTIKRLKKERDNLDEVVAGLEKKAWEQMASLNGLYNWEMFGKMVSAVMPQIEFDTCLSTSRLMDLKENYGWNHEDKPTRSVLYSHSGLINGNPFILWRTKEVNLIDREYSDSTKVEVVFTKRLASGEYLQEKKSERLYATHVAPYPEYTEKSSLIYACDAFPELSFSREKNTLKSRKFEKAGFDEIFGVESDLFTLVAKERMLELFKDSETGYGDNFSFEKNGKITTLSHEHLQSMNFDLNPELFKSFDFEKAQENFVSANTTYFKAFYFALAPLFCIPSYTKEGSGSKVSSMQISDYEYEAYANFIGQDKFKPEECATNCILKSERIDESTINVTAHGYKVEDKIYEKRVMASWGKIESVYVKWKCYTPVTKHTAVFLNDQAYGTYGKIN